MKDAIVKMPFAFICAAVTVVLSVVFLMTPSMNWEHPENWFFFYSCLDGFDKLGWVSGTLNLCFDGWTARPRVLSWIAFIVNSDLRKWAFEFLPYHASFSVTWILSLGVFPILFYKVLRKLDVDIEGSVLSVCLYFFTVGHLSTHLLYFHQAKPMSTFFLILSFWLAFKVVEGKNKWFILGLVTSLFLGTMWDEVFFYTFPFILILLPYLCGDKDKIVRVGGAIGGSLVLFLMAATFVIPWAFKKFRNFDFDFWKYAISSNSGLGGIKLENIWFNGKVMLFNHILPISNFGDLSDIPIYFWLAPVLLLGFSIYRLRSKQEIGKILLLFVVYTVFQSILLTRREGTLFLGSYYWGHLFSLVFVIALALVFKAKSSDGNAFVWVRRLVFVFFAVTCAYNSLKMNKLHEEENLARVTSDFGMKEFGVAWHPLTSGERGDVSWSDVHRVWSKRDNLSDAMEELKKTPDNGYWMFMHLYRQHFKYVRTRGAVWGIGIAE